MPPVRRGQSKSPWFKESDLCKSHRRHGDEQPIITKEARKRRWRREAVEIVHEARDLGDELMEVWEE